MIDYKTYMRIRNYATRDGLNVSQISDELSLDQRTVARWANKTRFLQRKSALRTSKLDPFKKDILQMLEKHRYTGRQVF